MKKLILLLTFFWIAVIALLTRATCYGQDSTLVVSDCQIKYDTTLTKTVKCSTWVKVPVTEGHSMYVNYEDVLTWMANPHKYLTWAKNEGTNYLLLYARSLMTSTSNRAKIAAFKKVAASYGMGVSIDCREIVGRFDEINNWKKYYAEWPGAIYKINATTEKEPYVTGDYAGFWPFLAAWDKLAAQYNFSFDCYMGHPTQQGWDSIVFHCDKIFLSKYISMSTYNGGRSYNYVAGRWQYIANSVKKIRPNNPMPVEYIVSLERISWGEGNEFQGVLYLTNKFWGLPWEQDKNDYKNKASAEIQKYTRLTGECMFSSKLCLKARPVQP